MAMPNGSQATSHKLDTITITADRQSVIVTSFTAADALCWTDSIEIAEGVITADPLNDVAGWLLTTYLAGGMIEADQTPLEVRKLTSLKRVDQLRDLKVNAGCETPAGAVQTDDVSIRNILGSVQTASLAVMMSQPFSIDWRMADNALVTLDANEMIAMGVAVMQHIKLTYARSWALKSAIEACQDEVSLAALALTL